MNERTVSAGPKKNTILEARKLTKVYGGGKGSASHTALDGFDLTVREGEFLGIMGPSGSGKTTLLNILATIDTPTSGSLQINGIDPTAKRNDELALFRRRELGFVFQDFNLLDTLSLRENILLPLILDRTSHVQMKARLGAVARTLGIEQLLDRRPYEVSGGQQQRAAIARAIIHQPSLLLADEPTGNLDSASAHDVMSAFRELNSKLDASLLMVTHDPYAASYCSRVLFIRDGKPFTELHSSSNRQAFFQQLLDTLGVMGASFR